MQMKQVIVTFFLMGNQNITSSRSRETFHFLNVNIVQYLMKILPNFIPVDISCAYTGFPSYHLYVQLSKFHSSCKHKTGKSFHIHNCILNLVNNIIFIPF